MFKSIDIIISTCVLTLLPLLGNAQTCYTNSIPASTPTQQFTNHNDGTVTDTKTNLMWKKCSEGQTWNMGLDSCEGASSVYSWKAALEHTQTINGRGGFGGYVDWRVPNAKELLSITEKQCYSPAVNLAIFPSVSPDALFSSSSIAMDDSSIFSVSFFDGRLVTAVNKHENQQVRLVRDAL